MKKEDIQKLRELPIEEVAERLGLEVARHKSLCPFHDDHHASLAYNQRRNNCRCYVCMDRPLGTIDLVMRHLRVDFPKACQWLADKNNVILEKWQPAHLRPPRPTINSPKPFDAARYERHFEHPWLSDEARRFLFEERRLDPRVVSWCRITSWQDHDGTHWLQTPYFAPEGRLIGLQYRNLDHGQPRFRFPYGAKCGIYNQPVLRMLRPGEPLYITEGCSDCWAMLSAGHKAIAIPSATLLSPDDRRLLLQLSERLHTEWHMYPDRDAPGERLFMQLQQLLPSLQHHQLPPGCKDFGEAYLRSIESRKV